MNVVIEVEAATGGAILGTPRVISLNRDSFLEVGINLLASASTSITRFISMGKTSLSAVSPDNYFLNGGMPVAL